MNYDDADVIVVGNAFINKYDFVGKEVITYQEMVSYLCDKYYSIAVCGTHGKTTITNMIKHVLSNIDDVSYLVGDGQGKGSPHSKYFVFEACEHKDHFLSYFPNIVVCDNVDYDHVEYFENKRMYKKSFNIFFNRAKDYVIVNKDIKCKCDCHTYGNKKANFTVNNINYMSNGIRFDLIIDNKTYLNLYLPFYGRHMLNDALACISTCFMLDMDIPTIIKSLQTYKPAKRRYNKIIKGSNVIIDDYGHHPKEIEATIDSIKQEYPNKDLIIFYHPDRPKRLTAFLYKYQKVFKKAKQTYVLPFISEGKEETNALISVIDNKKIKLYSEKNINKSYENTIFLLTGSKEMKNVINKLLSL